MLEAEGKLQVARCFRWPGVSFSLSRRVRLSLSVQTHWNRSSSFVTQFVTQFEVTSPKLPGKGACAVRTYRWGKEALLHLVVFDVA